MIESKTKQKQRKDVNFKKFKMLFHFVYFQILSKEFKKTRSGVFFYKRVDLRKFDETPSWVIVFNFQLQQKSKILKVHTYFDAILKQWS